MLEKLTVTNYALIRQLEMELSPSLNIITGETGAGKSILLGALGLVLGNRADTAVLKETERNCVIEATFDLDGLGLEPFFGENDLDFDRHTTIRRVITPAGKSRAYVNDLPVQLSTLKELSGRLIDIHSQNRSALVGDESFRMEVIDRLAGDEALRTAYRTCYTALRDREKTLQRLREETREYCFYMAVKNAFGGRSWSLWDEDIRLGRAEAVREYRRRLTDEIGFYEFQQMKFGLSSKKIKTV